MSAGSISHDWVRARLGAWAAGILDDGERQSLEAHLAECERCRSLAADLDATASEAAGGEHIPSTMLASWNRVAPEASGEIRGLLEHHLEHCQDCRRELEALGLDPGLIRTPQVGPGRSPVPAAPGESLPGKGRVLRLAERRVVSARFRWAQRLAIAAMLALVSIPVGVYMVAQLRTASRERLVTRPSPPPDAGRREAHAPAATPSLLALGAAQGIALDETYREASKSQSTPVVSFDPIRHEIVFAVPTALTLAEGDRVRLAVLDETGSTRRSLETTTTALFPADGSRSIIIRQGQPPLQAGRYILRARVLSGTGGEPEEFRYPFEIR